MSEISYAIETPELPRSIRAPTASAALRPVNSDIPVRPERPAIAATSRLVPSQSAGIMSNANPPQNSPIITSKRHRTQSPSGSNTQLRTVPSAPVSSVASSAAMSESDQEDFIMVPATSERISDQWDSRGIASRLTSPRSRALSNTSFTPTGETLVRPASMPAVIRPCVSPSSSPQSHPAPISSQRHTYALMQQEKLRRNSGGLHTT